MSPLYRLEYGKSRGVTDPGDWHDAGYTELLAKRQRYTILDTDALMALLGIDAQDQLIEQRKEWVTQALDSGMGDDARDPRWSGGIAVGTYEFVESVQWGLGHSIRERSIVGYDGSCILREEETPYDAILPIEWGF
jgi:hypothetical protein